MQSSAKARNSSASSHVQAVNVTSGGLIKATVGAMIAAGAILTFVWLPAEYGIDPTGAGHLLGLTEMGHIKEQLHIEADADAATAVAAIEVNKAVVNDAQKIQANADITRQLDEIQAQLVAIAATVGVGQTTGQISSQAASVENAAQATEQAVVVEPQVVPAAVSATPEREPEAEPALWRHEQEYTLVPGEGIELKLVMNEGAVATFEWSANGSVLNHDTHGDGKGQNISYEKGRSVPEQAGELTAAFAGNHGWFWRNRTDKPVLLTLRTGGEYDGILPP